MPFSAVDFREPDLESQPIFSSSPFVLYRLSFLLLLLHLSRQIPLRYSNGVKAHDNYNRKLKFLQSELVKYSTYIESLRAAINKRMELRGEKAMQRTLTRAERSVGEAAGRLGSLGSLST